MIGNKLEPFKFWCQKVLPNVYDDSLSYYEYLCKLNEYLNEVIGQINTLTDNMEDYETDLTAQWTTYRDDLTEQWTTTKNYIDNYFNNLNVQTEINNKLDQMVEDGTLDNILLPYFNLYTTNINNIVATQNEAIATLSARVTEIASLPEGSTSGDAELIDIRVPASGFNEDEPYASAGNAVRGQITTVNNDLQNVKNAQNTNPLYALSFNEYIKFDQSLTSVYDTISPYVSKINYGNIASISGSSPTVCGLLLWCNETIYKSATSLSANASVDTNLICFINTDNVS